MKELADKIIKDFTGRMNQYPDSRFVPDEDITLAALIARIEELEQAEDQLKNYYKILEITDSKIEYVVPSGRNLSVFWNGSWQQYQGENVLECLKLFNSQFHLDRFLED